MIPPHPTLGPANQCKGGYKRRLRCCAEPARRRSSSETQGWLVGARRNKSSKEMKRHTFLCPNYFLSPQLTAPKSPRMRNFCSPEYLSREHRKWYFTKSMQKSGVVFYSFLESVRPTSASFRVSESQRFRVPRPLVPESSRSHVLASHFPDSQVPKSHVLHRSPHVPRHTFSHSQRFILLGMHK